MVRVRLVYVNCADPPKPEPEPEPEPEPKPSQGFLSSVVIAEPISPPSLSLGLSLSVPRELIQPLPLPA